MCEEGLKPPQPTFKNIYMDKIRKVVVKLKKLEIFRELLTKILQKQMYFIYFWTTLNITNIHAPHFIKK